MINEARPATGLHDKWRKVLQKYQNDRTLDIVVIDYSVTANDASHAKSGVANDLCVSARLETASSPAVCGDLLVASHALADQRQHSLRSRCKLRELGSFLRCREGLPPAFVELSRHGLSDATLEPEYQDDRERDGDPNGISSFNVVNKNPGDLYPCESDVRSIC